MKAVDRHKVTQGLPHRFKLWLLLAVEGRKLTKAGADGGLLPCRMAQWEGRLIWGRI